MPPPTPPMVNDGRMIDGKPVCSTITSASASDFATPLAGTIQQVFPVQQPVQCGGVTVNPGDIVFGDEDGIIVASMDELETLLPLAEQIDARERAVIARLEAGEGLLSMLNFEEHRANLEAGRDSALRFLI